MEGTQVPPLGLRAPCLFLLTALLLPFIGTVCMFSVLISFFSPHKIQEKMLPSRSIWLGSTNAPGTRKGSGYNSGTERREKTRKVQIHSSTNYLSCTKFSVYFCLSFLEDMFLKVQLKDQHVLQDNFQVTCLKVYTNSPSHQQSVNIVHFTTPSPASNVHVFF